LAAIDVQPDQTRLDEFGALWIDSFAWPHLPLYLHVLICHYNSLYTKFNGRLKELSQEGTESHHLLQKRIEDRSTARGGGRGATVISVCFATS